MDWSITLSYKGCCEIRQELSMVKDQTGRCVDQLDPSPKSSVMHYSITECMSTRQLPCLRH